MTLETLRAELAALEAAVRAADRVVEAVLMTERMERATREFLTEARWHRDSARRALAFRLEEATLEEERRGWPGDEPGFTARNAARKLLEDLGPKESSR